MKLDPDLIKKILTAMKETETAGSSEGLYGFPQQIEGYSDEILIYHIRQLINAGFIDGEVINSIGEMGTDVFIKTSYLGRA